MAIEQHEGLRERKRQKTRETISRVALKLFSENGYQHTTIAQIAEAAEVSPRTVSTYFPVKEEIVFGLRGDVEERLSSAIHDRPEGTTTMEALRGWIEGERDTFLSHEEEMLCMRKVVDSDESLQFFERAQFAKFQLLLAEGLATDLDQSFDDIEPRMAAAAAAAVFDVLGNEKHSGDEGKLPEVDDQLDLLNQAITFITGGVNAMRDARKSS